eukprot:gene12408-8450_t
MRLGDLLAMVNVYFDCLIMAAVSPFSHWRDTRAALEGTAFHGNASLLAALKRRGFSSGELLANHAAGACSRRDKPQKEKWLPKITWHHPATDGSYRPQPLPPGFDEAVVAHGRWQSSKWE